MQVYALQPKTSLTKRNDYSLIRLKEEGSNCYAPITRLFLITIYLYDLS